MFQISSISEQLFCSFSFYDFLRDQILTKQWRLEGPSSVIDFEYLKFLGRKDSLHFTKTDSQIFSLEIETKRAYTWRRQESPTPLSPFLKTNQGEKASKAKENVTTAAKKDI